MRALCWLICVRGFYLSLIKTHEVSAVWPCGQKAWRSLSEPWFPDLQEGDVVNQTSDGLFRPSSRAPEWHTVGGLVTSGGGWCLTHGGDGCSMLGGQQHSEENIARCVWWELPGA